MVYSIVADVDDVNRILKRLKRNVHVAKVVIIVLGDTKDPKFRGLLGGIKSAYNVDIKKTLIIS